MPTHVSIKTPGEVQFSVPPSYQMMRQLVARCTAPAEAGGRDRIISSVTLQQIGLSARRAHDEPACGYVKLCPDLPPPNALMDGKVVELWPDLLPRIIRKTADWRKAAQDSGNVELQALAKMVCQKNGRLL